MKQREAEQKVLEKIQRDGKGGNSSKHQRENPK